MNEKKISLGFFAGLVSSATAIAIAIAIAIAACGGVGEDGFITVGIRPTEEAAAIGGATAGDAGSLPIPGSDVMNETLDGDTNRPRGTAGVGASDAAAGALANAGSAAAVAGRGGEAALPDATTAGAGGARIGAAGAGGSVAANEDECGAIPSQPAGKVTSGRVSRAGLIEYNVGPSNVLTGLRTTLAVPAEPAANGQVFIWPGIQPTATGTNLQPIGNGALLSVLAWGPLCLPDVPATYSTWWVASMYSNISTSDPQYAGCHGGKVVRTAPSQLLDIDIHLEGTRWVQRVINRDTMEASDFSLDLKGQVQGRAIFDIELQTSNKPTEDIVFSNTVLSMELSDPEACEPVTQGMNDFASKPRVSADGKYCCIDRIVLRAPRVMATTMDPP